MICPEDRTELRTERYESIAVDRCPTCAGVWLDPGELARLQESAERAGEAARRAGPAAEVAGAFAMAHDRARPPFDCPRGHGPMERREHGYCSQVLIDVCPKCRGAWLDGGELAELERFYAAARAEAGGRLRLLGSLRELAARVVPG